MLSGPEPSCCAGPDGKPSEDRNVPPPLYGGGTEGSGSRLYTPPNETPRPPAIHRRRHRMHHRGNAPRLFMRAECAQNGAAGRPGWCERTSGSPRPRISQHRPWTGRSRSSRKPAATCRTIRRHVTRNCRDGTLPISATCCGMSISASIRTCSSRSQKRTCRRWIGFAGQNASGRNQTNPDDPLSLTYRPNRSPFARDSAP